MIHLTTPIQVEKKVTMDITELPRFFRNRQNIYYAIGGDYYIRVYSAARLASVQTGKVCHLSSYDVEDMEEITEKDFNDKVTLAFDMLNNVRYSAN